MISVLGVLGVYLPTITRLLKQRLSVQDQWAHVQTQVESVQRGTDFFVLMGDCNAWFGELHTPLPFSPSLPAWALCERWLANLDAYAC